MLFLSLSPAFACDLGATICPVSAVVQADVNAAAGVDVIHAGAAARLQPDTIDLHVDELFSVVDASACDILGTVGGVYSRGTWSGLWRADGASAEEMSGSLDRPAKTIDGAFYTGGSPIATVGGDFGTFASSGEIAADIDGDGLIAGRWIRTSGANGVFVGIYGSCGGADPATELDDWFPGDLAPAETELFTDTMDSASSWTVDCDAAPDADAVFGYDYSADGIPNAPNGSDSVGLRMRTNLADGTTSSMCIVRRDHGATGSYRFEADVWSDFVAAGGSTELAGVGVGHDGVAGPTRSGASFELTGDGGSAFDFRLFADDVSLVPGTDPEWDAGIASRNSSDEPWATLVDDPSNRPGLKWLHLTVEVDGDTGL
ncbi:MAG: hypothetical protein KC656_00995, partial [Myxococcales bacterium]|nr:hypothetical protein [Myxococcales bacterium]